MSKIQRKKRIYLDYAASTPVDPTVLKAMLPYFSKEYGNPSSIHGFGQKVLAAIDEARENVAAFLGCEANEVVFTGSATEANNLAIRGTIFNFQFSIFPPEADLPLADNQFSNSQFSNNFAAQTLKPHIITSQIEHESILETCRALEKEGIEITYLPVTKDGFVRPEDVSNALKENTVLVSIMYANNEIGTIQPIAEISKIVRDFRNYHPKTLKSKQIQNTNRSLRSLSPLRGEAKFKIQNSPYFHTDAVQAANYLDCSVDKLGVDLLTLSGHKIYGPKGVGVLYIRKGTHLQPLLFGGGQEFGLRPGTENVAAIAGFGAAIAKVKSQKSRVKSIEKLRDMLIDGVLRVVPGARLNGSRDNRLPNNANFCFPGVDAETLIIALEQEGIAVSSGSACSTRALQPSHVLLGIGLSEQDARSSVRVTLGKYTTKREIKYFLTILPKVVKRIKMLS